MFLRRKTKENHTKSVQNVKESGVFPRKNQGKATKKADPPQKKDPITKSTQGLPS